MKKKIHPTPRPRRLFTELWKRGVIIITTGNRNIDDLYQNGIQYKNFKPFIPLLKQHNQQIDMTGGDDYRKMGKTDFGETYFVDDEVAFHRQLKRLTGYFDPERLSETVLKVFNRPIVLPRTFSTKSEQDKKNLKIAYCTFNELCNQPLGSNDYITIAENFSIIFIKGLESLDLQTRRAEARRFISLIDTLYDSRTGVVFLSNCQAKDIFVINNWNQHSWSEEERQFMEQFYGGERMIGDDAMKQAGTNEKFAITSGEDEKFALARLLSRLEEMRSEGYWEDVLKTFDLGDEARPGMTRGEEVLKEYIEPIEAGPKTI